MRILIPLALLVIAFTFACRKNSSSEQQALTDAIKAFDATPSDSTAKHAYDAYFAFVSVKGYEDSATPDLILEIARIANAQKDYPRAFAFYKEYIVQYPDRKDQADRFYEAIGVAEKYAAPQVKDILYKGFEARYAEDKRTAELSAKIQEKNTPVDSMLRHIGMNMFNDSTFRLNEEKANIYIQACEAAIMANRELANAPEHLHRAAETAITLRNIPEALAIYDWIITQYDSHPKAPMALFLKAFTYDNELSDFTTAGKYYNEFLTRYPNDEYAESARFLLTNLGKSDEELMKLLQKDTTKVLQ